MTMGNQERGELVRSYLDGSIGRRVFVRRLLAAGISAAAAISYADVLGPSTARAAARRARGGADVRGGFHLPNGFYNFYVGVVDNQFGPQSVQVYRRGDSVSWGFVGSKDHSATERSGLDFFDSGYAPPDRIMFTMVFPAAGTFPYHCKDPHHASTMKGNVKVLVGRNPAFGPVGSQFTIKWAQKAADPGYVFDVQIRKPGDSSFHPFKTGVTTAQAHFTPNQHGQFQFRGRVRNKSTGLASWFSPPSSISVLP
jgi:plastocyanin